MMPVSTSTDGRWVARIRWMPAARAIWARRVRATSTSREATIIRSASSSMMITIRGSGSGGLASGVSVRLGFVLFRGRLGDFWLYWARLRTLASESSS
jgi:hypothetical protein